MLGRIFSNKGAFNGACNRCLLTWRGMQTLPLKNKKFEIGLKLVHVYENMEEDSVGSARLMKINSVLWEQMLRFFVNWNVFVKESMYHRVDEHMSQNIEDMCGTGMITYPFELFDEMVIQREIDAFHKLDVNLSEENIHQLLLGRDITLQNIYNAILTEYLSIRFNVPIAAIIEKVFSQSQPLYRPLTDYIEVCDVLEKWDIAFDALHPRYLDIWPRGSLLLESKMISLSPESIRKQILKNPLISFDADAILSQESYLPKWFYPRLEEIDLLKIFPMCQEQILIIQYLHSYHIEAPSKELSEMMETVLLEPYIRKYFHSNVIPRNKLYLQQVVQRIRKSLNRRQFEATKFT